jgi:hypothetical protein
MHNLPIYAEAYSRLYGYNCIITVQTFEITLGFGEIKYQIT